MNAYDETVLACRPVRIEDYPPVRRKIHANVVAKLGIEPPIYPGSVYQRCAMCGIEVAVGPRQQEALRLDPNAVVCCLIDAAVRASMGTHDVESLGNPFRRQP